MVKAGGAAARKGNFSYLDSASSIVCTVLPAPSQSALLVGAVIALVLALAIIALLV
jgi:hypothetical protein